MSIERLQEEVAALLSGNAFKLTDEEKEQLLKILPELKDHFPTIETICQLYILWSAANDDRFPRAEFLKYMFGLISKLKEGLEANKELMKVIVNPDDGSSQPYVPPALLATVKETINQLEWAIDVSENLMEAYKTNREVKELPRYRLASELADLCHKITGREVHRRNPIDASLEPSERSLIREIAEVLDTRLHCGALPKIIRKVLKHRKEFIARSDDDSTPDEGYRLVQKCRDVIGLPDDFTPDDEGYNFEQRRKDFTTQIERDIAARKEKLSSLPTKN